MARKEKKFHFIYKTTNLLSGKYYLGMHSTDDLNDGYMGSGKRLRYSINKYGKNNHKVEIIEFVDSIDKLKDREKEIITLNEIAKVECMNLTIGGEGGPTRFGHTHSEESKNKIRNSLIGQKLSEERKMRISESGKGKHSGSLSYEHRIKISKGKKGIPSKLRGVSRSEETKNKISIANKGKNTESRGPLSEETKNKISMANKGKLSKKVIQLDMDNNIIKIWESGLLAETTLGITHISKVCNGERNSAGGFKWKFIEFYCDDKRHLVSQPYSIDFLHAMGEFLSIKSCWFHKDHYDIPKRRIEEIKEKCRIVTSKEIVTIVRGIY